MPRIEKQRKTEVLFHELLRKIEGPGRDQNKQPDQPSYTYTRIDGVRIHRKDRADRHRTGLANHLPLRPAGRPRNSRRARPSFARCPPNAETMLKGLVAA